MLDKSPFGLVRQNQSQLIKLGDQEKKLSKFFGSTIRKFCLEVQKTDKKAKKY